MMEPIIIIPTRYDSERVPGKPFRALGSKTVIGRCLDLCRETEFQTCVVGDRRMVEKFETSGMVWDLWKNIFCVVDAPCRNGTERVTCLAVMMNLPDDQIIINVQGDHAYIAPRTIKAVAERKLSMPYHDVVVTAHYDLRTIAEWENPNRVKIEVAKNGSVSSFSPPLF